MPWRQGLRFVLGALAGVSAAAEAGAKPKWNAGLETGVCGTGSAPGFEELGWCNALRADVLFLRERGADFGIGPALRLGSVAFDDLRLDAGLSVLLPLFESFPLQLEAGPHLLDFDQPGVYASAFFGLRSFNHYGGYEMSAGLALTVERAFSTGTPSAIWLTARIDGSWLALPFVFLYNAAR
jgi:hypothetical protein